MKIFNVLRNAAFIVPFTFLLIPSQAQSIHPLVDSSGISQKNILKLNVPALFIKNFSFQYERAISAKNSLAVGIRYMPEAGLPIKSTFKALIDNADTWKNAKNLRNIKLFNYTRIPLLFGEKSLPGLLSGTLC